MTLLKTLIVAVLYAGLTIGANPLLSAGAIPADIDALRIGEMRKLGFHSPDAPIEVSFLDSTGNQVEISEFSGKLVLLNFWATWCAPCRKEMPSLDRLQQELGGNDFSVVTIASGRNPPEMVRQFFAAEGITNLEAYRDPSQNFTRAHGVFGLPISLIINADGAEIARLRGDADWHSPQAVALLKALISSQP